MTDGAASDSQRATYPHPEELPMPIEAPIRQIMSTEVISIDPGLTVDIAIETMTANDVRRLPILSDSGRVVGIITLHQAQIAMPKGSNFFSAGPEDVPTIRETMTDYVYTIGPDDSIGRAAQMMANHKIGALPVVDEGKHVVGIVTESDMMRFLAEQFEQSE